MCTGHCPVGNLKDTKNILNRGQRLYRDSVIQRVIHIKDDDYNMVRLETGEASYGAGFHKFKNGING